MVKEEIKELRTFTPGHRGTDEYSEDVNRKKRRHRSKRKSDLLYPISQGVVFDETDDEVEPEYTVKDVRGSGHIQTILHVTPNSLHTMSLVSDKK